MVGAALAAKDSLAAQQELPVLLAVDDYNALYSRTGYYESVHNFHRRQLAPEELRLVSRRTPRLKRGVLCLGAVGGLPAAPLPSWHRGAAYSCKQNSCGASLPPSTTGPCGLPAAPPAHWLGAQVAGATPAAPRPPHGVLCISPSMHPAAGLPPSPPPPPLPLHASPQLPAAGAAAAAPVPPHVVCALLCLSTKPALLRAPPLRVCYQTCSPPTLPVIPCRHAASGCWSSRRQPTAWP